MKKYKILLIDPPWEYRNKKTGGSMKSGAGTKYPTLSLSELASLNLPADKNSVLFLWATIPLLPDAIWLMKEWGFRYKTSLIWRKIMSLGMGYWFRGQCEILLMGIKGKIKAFRIQKPNFIQSKAGRHSEKPKEFRKLIEATKLKPRIELFGRRRIRKWTVLGNEIDGKDIKEILK